MKAGNTESSAPDQMPDREAEIFFDRVSIRKRGKKWQIRYRFEGKEIRKSLGTNNKKLAERKARIIDAHLIEGIHEPKKQSPSIEDEIANYLATQKAKGCRESTLERYDAELKRILDFAKSKHTLRVNGLTRAFFDAYRVWRSPQVKSSTLYHELNVLKQFVNHLFTRGVIPSNGLKGERLKKPKYGNQVCFSPKQAEDLIREATPPYDELFAVLAYTGMRINEALHLTWGDIDFENGFIHIRAKKGWLPKTGENRKLPIFSRIRPVLECRRKAEGFVFTGKPSKEHPKGGQPLMDRRALQALKTALKRAGLKEGKLHSFRHAFVSMCANAGVPPLVVAKWTGHATLSMHQQYYSLSDEESLRMIQKLPDLATGTGPAT